MTTNVGRPWRLAPVLASLRQEIDVGWPSRSTASDGSIGDRRHASSKSDHNPNDEGYVRALDITHDPEHGPPLDLLADFIRRVGATGSQRLSHGGYVIWERRIASERTQWRWIAYKGENPHLRHMHVSCSLLPAFYKISRPWQVVDALARARW